MKPKRDHSAMGKKIYIIAGVAAWEKAAMPWEQSQATAM